MKIRYFYILLVAAAQIFSAQTYAQNTEKSKYKLAESYEKIGDNENAARIYEELYKTSPYNSEYFNGLVRTYKARSMFAPLLPIVEKQAKEYKEPNIYVLLGELQWRTGSPAGANSSWAYAMEIGADDDSLYNFLAITQVNLGLYDKAITTYETGRKNIGSKKIFAGQLSQLFIATGDNERAVIEIFNLFDLTGDIPLAQGRLSAVLTNKGASEIVRRQLEEKQKQSSTFVYKFIYAWFLRTVSDFELAFEVYKEIDTKSNAGGREVLYFANDSRNDGHYDIAIKAYEFILDKGKGGQFFQQAIYGYARTLEQKIEKEPNIGAEKYESIVERYKNIISEFPETSIAFDCRLRLADIYLNNLSELGKAEEELTFIVKNSKQPALQSQAANLLGETFLRQNDLNRAKLTFKEVIRVYSGRAPEESSRALFQIAEITYFLGEMDSAKTLFRQLITNSNAEYANNSLEKLGIIEENQKQPKALIDFATAELYERRKEFDKAEELYLEVAELANGSPLAELCYKKAGTIVFNKNDFSGAGKIFLMLLEKYPETIYGDYALIYIGNSYYAETKKELALEYFTKLLVKYPRSIYLQEARNKIRLIRTQI